MPRIAPLARLLRPTSSNTVLARTVPTLPPMLGQSSRSALIRPSSSPSSSLSFSTFLRPSNLLNRPSTSSLMSSLNALSLSVAGSSSGLGRQRQPTQVRTLAYGAMYQPSQRKRKRKHGFLSRSKGGRLGKKTLARRLARGRRFLSH